MSSCLLPAWFAALNGMGPPVMVPEPVVGGWAPAPPITGKAYPFALSRYTHDTDNFTIQWDDPSIPESLAILVGDNLEEAWSVYVEDRAWVAPPTTDSYRLLAYMTRDLEAAGLATFTETDWFPDGVPIIYLNPDYTEPMAYFEGVVHHEFSHTVQFAVRDWYSGGPEEWWYWEASSTWMQEYVRPEYLGSTWMSEFVMTDPTLAFDTVNYGHEYGMYVLNMFLEELSIGWLGFQSIWMDNSGMSWLEEIERVTEEPAAETWAHFVGAYMGRKLSDSEHFTYPMLETEPKTIAGHLGAQYLDLGEAEGTLFLDGGIGTLVRDDNHLVFVDSVAIPDGVGDVTLIVTNPNSEPLDFTFFIEPSDQDTGVMDDTGVIDTGIPAGSSGGSDSVTSQPPTEPKGAGCAALETSQWLWWTGLVVVFRRRFGSQRESRPR